MRAVVQRVLRAGVDCRRTDGPHPAAERWERVGEVGLGLCVLVGVTHDDDHADARRLADKLMGLRIFDDADGVMNLDLATATGVVASSKLGRPTDGDPLDPAPGVLVVSQFTLYGDTRKGRRPSWVDAARPETAEPLVETVVERLRELTAGTPLHVATGRFRTEMRVDLVNDGPVTLLVEV